MLQFSVLNRATLNKLILTIDGNVRQGDTIFALWVHNDLGSKLVNTVKFRLEDFRDFVLGVVPKVDCYHFVVNSSNILVFNLYSVNNVDFCTCLYSI